MSSPNAGQAILGRCRDYKSLGAPIFVFPPDEPPKACPCP